MGHLPFSLLNTYIVRYSIFIIDASREANIINLGYGGDNMIITIINGSPRKNGATAKILKYFKECLEKYYSNVNVNFTDLIDHNIKYCTGCENCYKTGKCIIADDNVENIRDLIKSSDGVIFSSPTYASNVTGLFKAFYDRVHMTMEHLLYRKPCITIIVYENLMGHKTTRIMKEMVMNSGGYTVSSLTIKNEFDKNPLTDKNKCKIEKSVKIFVKNIKNNNPPLFSKLYTKIAINIFLKPFVFKNKEKNKGIIDSWLENKIIKI
jgi:multimeric flavodoxin WrbA